MRFGSSLAVRITAALVVATFVTAASLLGGIYLVSVKQPMDAVRAELQAEADTLSGLYHRSGEEALKSALRDRRAAPSADKAFDAFLEANGQLITGNLPSWPVKRQGNWTTIEADLYRDGDEDDHESLSRDLLLGDGRRLIIGRDVEILADRKELMIESMRWSSISILLFGLIGGLLISRITARRLEAVTRTARAVMQGNLSVRVPIQGNGDDFDQLGLSLNAMLDRNQQLMASLGRVSDNVAHELRTPLTRLQAVLDGAATGDGLEDRIGAARIEADRLQRTFDALLRIARIDTGRHQIAKAPVELAGVVGDAIELYEPQAEERAQRLSSELSQCTVTGDRNLLFQAVANLLDNAIKFAPEGGTVGVILHLDGLTARLAITDNGPGVDEQHQARLSERFYRAPGSEHVAGTGLGLSLVCAIAAAHDGSLTFSGGPGRFSANLNLPVAG